MHRSPFHSPGWEHSPTHSRPRSQVQDSNSQLSNWVPPASDVKIRSQGTEVELLPTTCVQVLEILPPLVAVAKSANVHEINAGKLVCALGTWPAATVNVTW